MFALLHRKIASKILHVNDPSSSSKLRVVIFGGNSQLAPSLGNLLGYLGAQITYPTRTSAKWIDHLKTTVSYKNVAIPQFIDYKDPNIIDRLIANNNVVISLVGANQYLKDDDLIYEGNVTIPKRIAEACARSSDVVRFIHFSAAGADPSSISSRLRTKWIGEQEVKAACPEATVIRPTTIFGEGDNFVMRLAFLQRWLGFIPVIGDAKELRQPIHYHDVGLATVNALKIPESIGKTYELGGPYVYSMKETLEIIYDKLGIPPRIKSYTFDGAHKLFTKVPHVHAFTRHMSLNLVRESKINIVVGKDALGIDKLFVKPLTFPQNLQRILADYQAKTNLTLEEAEHGWNGGNDRHFSP